MSSGGGGQSGITRYDWNDTMARYYQGSPENPGGWLGRANDIAWKPYESYNYATVAGTDPYQDQAMQGIYNTIYGHGAADTEAGREAARQFASGQNGNQYGGFNPFFQDMVGQGAEDIIKAYQQGTSADTTRMFNLSGAFGGSAHQNAIANNEAALGKELNRYVTGMYGGQFDRAAGIESEDLNRQLQSIPLAQAGQGLSFDAFRNLMGAGDFRRSVTQQNYDDAYRRWSEAQNFDWSNVDRMLNVLGRAQGSTGVTTQTSPYGGLSPAAGLLGAAALYGGINTPG